MEDSEFMRLCYLSKYRYELQCEYIQGQSEGTTQTSGVYSAINIISKTHMLLSDSHLISNYWIIMKK